MAANRASTLTPTLNPAAAREHVAAVVRHQADEVIGGLAVIVGRYPVTDAGDPMLLEQRRNVLAKASHERVDLARYCDVSAEFVDACVSH